MNSTGPATEDASTPRSPGVPWLGRTFFGLVAAALGGAIAFVLVSGAPGRASTLSVAIAQGWMLAWTASGLLAFAASQAWRLLYVGGDQRLDQRIWAGLTPRQRSAWNQRVDASGRLTFWLFVVLVAVLTVVIDARWLPVVGRAGSWTSPAAMTLALVNLAAALLPVLTLFATGPPPPSPGQVAPHRWVLEMRQQRPASHAPLWLLAGIVFAIATGLLGWGTPDPGDRAIAALLCLGGVAVAVDAVRTLRRERREAAEPLRLEIRRTASHPPVLACTALVPTGSRKKLAASDWVAKLVAGRAPAQGAWDTWLSIEAPAWVEEGTHRLSFTLRLALPADLPAGSSLWSLQLARRRPGGAFYEAQLADEIVFPQKAAVVHG